MPTLNSKEKKTLVEVGLRLRSIRAEKGWTLEDVEERGFPSWRHLQRIETGNKNVTIITLSKLAKIYKKTLSALLEGI
jgi:transcriptional regulator with XRE-family HTH domain